MPASTIKPTMRKELVARLFLAGHNAHAITRLLSEGHNKGVAYRTVAKDIEEIKLQWHNDPINVKEVIGNERAKLDQIEVLAATEFDKDPDPNWLRIRLQVAERRAKMLGLDAPDKIQRIEPPQIIVEFAEVNNDDYRHTEGYPAIVGETIIDGTTPV